MKKIVTVILAVLLIASFAVSAYADTSAQEQLIADLLHNTPSDGVLNGRGLTPHGAPAEHADTETHISESISEQKRALDQPDYDPQNGSDIEQTAGDAVNGTSDIPEKERELTEQAASGTETDSDDWNDHEVNKAQTEEELERIRREAGF